MARPQTVSDDDELGELPPLDGDLKDASDQEETAEKNLEIPPEDGGSEDEAPGLPSPDDLEVPDLGEGRSWLNAEADASDLDLGTAGLVELKTDTSVADDDPSGQLDEDTELWEGTGEGGLDGGDEGPLSADDDLRDEDLPALDADDGENADASFVDPHFAVDEPLGVAWAARPWPRVGAPLRVPSATAIACAGRYGLVALRGEGDAGAKRRNELVHVDLEGSCRTLDAVGFEGPDVEALANEGTDAGLIAMVLRGGQLMTSRDGGARFEADAGGVVAADCAVALGRVWVRTQAGSLMSQRNGAFEECSLHRLVTALASDNGRGIAALTVADDASRRAIARPGPDGTFTFEPITGDVGEATVGASSDPREREVLAIRAGHVAYLSRAGIARRGPDGRWLSFSGWEGWVTTMAFVDDRGTLLLAAYSEAEDMTGLVRIDEAGRLSIVARIGAPRDQGDSDGRVLSLACDDARGVVWVAGGFGVAAFSMGVD
jgi:hypothetical protein